MEFQDKVVIVTGASSGIGAATAVTFSEAGARVVMVGRNETKLLGVAARCTDPLVIGADVSNDEDAKRIIDQTIEKFAQLDVLVNNAGISVSGSLLNGDITKAYDEVMSVNLRAIIRFTSLASPYLIKTKGNIVNISSVGGQMPCSVPTLMTYSISKAGLNHFGVCAAVELAPHGVRVNTISPGPKYVFDLERPKVLFYDETFKYINLKCWRLNRSNPIHHINLKFELLKPLYNEDTYHVLDFYQLLSNRYKPSFVVIKLQLCDALDTFLKVFKENFERLPVSERPMPSLVCPILPGVYNFEKIKIPSYLIPSIVPFTEGRIFYNVTHKNKQILNARVDFQLKFENK